MLFLGKHSKPLDETEMDMFFTALNIYLYKASKWEKELTIMREGL